MIIIIIKTCYYLILEVTSNLLFLIKGGFNGKNSFNNDTIKLIE